VRVIPKSSVILNPNLGKTSSVLKPPKIENVSRESTASSKESVTEADKTSRKIIESGKDVRQ
jgi:hypothetical protein